MSAKNQVKTHRHQAFVRQGGRCYYCGVRMWLSSTDELTTSPLSPSALSQLRCTAEHLVARCEGGTDAASNIVAACAHCNRARHKKKIPLEPAAHRERVRRRMVLGRWHPRPVFELGLTCCSTGMLGPVGTAAEPSAYKIARVDLD